MLRKKNIIFAYEAKLYLNQKCIHRTSERTSYSNKKNINTSKQNEYNLKHSHTQCIPNKHIA